jgi:hypothetical protein
MKDIHSSPTSSRKKKQEKVKKREKETGKKREQNRKFNKIMETIFESDSGT